MTNTSFKSFLHFNHYFFYNYQGKKFSNLSNEPRPQSLLNDVERSLCAPCPLDSVFRWWSTVLHLFSFLPRCVVTKPPASVTSLGQAQTVASGTRFGTPTPRRTKDLRVCVISVLSHCRLHSPAPRPPHPPAPGCGRRHSRIHHFAVRCTVLGVSYFLGHI